MLVVERQVARAGTAARRVQVPSALRVRLPAMIRHIKTAQIIHLPSFGKPPTLLIKYSALWSTVSQPFAIFGDIHIYHLRSPILIGYYRLRHVV